MAGISSSSMAKLTNCGNVTTEVLIKICSVLDCDISDITEIVKEEK
ncbi:MAG: helix-turn-helix transcriptional regulator [Clostridiales bacterium]|nr:helix-turn-helix transcriptional regulator [Clostridiales bacterium]